MDFDLCLELSRLCLCGTERQHWPRLLIVRAGRILGRAHAIPRSAFAGLLLWISLFTTAASEPRDQINREISTFQQFYDLSNAELKNGKALRLEAFVLCYDSGWNQLYVHDGKLTVYFDPKLFRAQPRRGQRVEITGLAAPVDGGRALTNLDLKILGPGTRPIAKRLTLPQLNSVRPVDRDRGTRSGADASLGRLALSLHDLGQPCLAYVMGPLMTNDFKWLLDCTVRLRAINGSRIVNGRLESAQITVPDFDEITILERPATKPLLSPVVSIGSLLNRELGPWTNNRVHVNGVISAYRAQDADRQGCHRLDSGAGDSGDANSAGWPRWTSGVS